MEKAKYGKTRQVTAVNGSQMAVKIGVGYYRRKMQSWGFAAVSFECQTTEDHIFLKLSVLLYLTSKDFSTIKNSAPPKQSAISLHSHFVMTFSQITLD